MKSTSKSLEVVVAYLPKIDFIVFGEMNRKGEVVTATRIDIWRR